jgi:hypothetical protein
VQTIYDMIDLVNNSLCQRVPCSNITVIGSVHLSRSNYLQAADKVIVSGVRSLQ